LFFGVFLFFELVVLHDGLSNVYFYKERWL